MRIVWAILLAVFMATSAFAGEASIKAVWNQAIPADGLKEWRMLMSETSGGPYAPFLVIPFVAAQNEYTQAAAITSPDGVAKKYYFVLQAVSKAGIASKNSNEASIIVNFEAPGSPTIINLTIELRTAVK